MTQRDESRRHHDIDPELAEEIDDHAQTAFGALKYGPARLAVEEFEWLVEIWTELAGEYDPHTMVQRAWLAKALVADDRPEQAAVIQRELVAARTAVLGPDDPMTLAMRGQLAQTLGRHGDPEAAIELLRPLLADRIRLFGPDHPSVFDTMGNLGEALLMADQATEGVEVYTELLARRTAALGPSHPDCLRTALNLAVGHAQSCADDDEALTILLANLEHQAEVDGWDSESAFVSRAHIAHFHRSRGNHAESELMYAALIDDSARVLGEDHALTVRYRWKLRAVRAERRKANRRSKRAERRGGRR